MAAETVSGDRDATHGSVIRVLGMVREDFVPAPGKPVEPCLGDRFQVLVSHADNKRHVLFYGRQSGKWQLCSAGTA